MKSVGRTGRRFIVPGEISQLCFLRGAMMVLAGQVAHRAHFAVRDNDRRIVLGI